MKYSIIIYDDTFTPFDFVVEILVKLLNYKEKDAIEKVKEIESKGSVRIPLFSYEISEAKVLEIKDYIKFHNFDLKIILEKENDVK